MSALILRIAQPEDAQNLASLAIKTYLETYRHHPANLPEDENNLTFYMAEHFTPLAIAESLQNSMNIYWLVEADNQLVGYLKLARENVPKQLVGKKVLGIEKIYILQAFQGQEIGKLLLEKAFEIAQTENCELVWLCVWKENKKAVHFYEKMSFVYQGDMPFRMGNEVYYDWLMVRLVNK